VKWLTVVIVPWLAAGCALLGSEAARALADADAYAAHGDYPAAMAAYDAYLSRYPEDGGARRARAVRALVKQLMAVREERDRLVARENDLARQNAELKSQAAEVAKLRQELAARQAEVARLRDDLAALKRTDLQMERRRR
jgi:predicted RNase H-like nuclease (RuvC/YqgF family)